MQSRGSCLGMPYLAKQLFFLSIQICLICMSDSVSFVKVRQNLFIQGDIEPGSVPQAQPLMPIIRAYRTTQKYLNQGRQPFLTRDWQVMSMALAIRKRPIDCRVCLARKRTDSSPPTSPASKGMYFCRYQSTTLLIEHKMLRNRPTNEPTKRPKRMASLPSRRVKSWEGALNIFLREKRMESPALMRQVIRAILGVDLRMESRQGPLCLQ